MKTKNKLMAMVEIAVVLCAVFLVALPAIAADQSQTTQEVSASEVTTASEDDYVLEIYGNANEDDTIDMGDVVYTKLAIFGKKPKTELCDAKYDGRINVLDVIQTKLIILGKEKELTFVDNLERAVTVNKPVKRIIAVLTSPGDAIKAIKAEDKVVAVSSMPSRYKIFYPYLSKLPVVGHDYEKIIELKAEAFITHVTSHPEYEEKLGPAGITVVRLKFNDADARKNVMMKLGYILDRREEADEYITWYEGWIKAIKSRTEGLSEDEKPRVYLGYWHTTGDMAGGKGSLCEPACRIAGGINIAADLVGYPKVDPEWVIEQNPDVIVKAVTSSFIAGGYGEDDPTEMKMLREEIMSQPGWDHVKAVKNGRVYLVTWQLWLGPHNIVYLTYLAKWFHPDLFEDLDPEAIHQEYVTRFHRLDFDVKKHGVFVYPPLEG